MVRSSGVGSNPTLGDRFFVWEHVRDMVGGDNDTGIDWIDSDDMLDLSSFGFADISAAMALATKMGIDVVVTVGSDTVTMEDTTLSEIEENLTL